MWNSYTVVVGLNSSTLSKNTTVQYNSKSFSTKSKFVSFDVACMGSPVLANNDYKKLTNKYTKN